MCKNTGHESLSAYLGNKKEVLQEQIEFVFVPVGSAIWVPAGYVAVATAIEDFVSKKKQAAKTANKTCSYLWHGMFDKEKIKDVPPKVAKELIDWGHKALSEKVQCFQEHQCHRAQMEYLGALSGITAEEVD